MLAVKATPDECAAFVLDFAGRSLNSRSLTAPRGSGFRPSMALLRKADTRVGFCQQKPRKAKSRIGPALLPGGAKRKWSSAEGCGRMLRIRLDLKTTGRCGPRRFCARRSRFAGCRETRTPSLAKRVS